MFETFAALSTIGCITILVVLYRMDRAERREEGEGATRTPDQKT